MYKCSLWNKLYGINNLHAITIKSSPLRKPMKHLPTATRSTCQQGSQDGVMRLKVGLLHLGEGGLDWVARPLHLEDWYVVGVWYKPSNWCVGERGDWVGGGSGLSVELLDIFWRDAVLSLCCIVVCGLLGLEEMAATGIATASESAEVATSLSVSAAV